MAEGNEVRWDQGTQSLNQPKFEVLIKAEWRIQVNQNIKEFFKKPEKGYLSWFWTWSKWFGISMTSILRLFYIISGGIYIKNKSSILVYHNFPLMSFEPLPMVVSQNPVSSSVGGLNLYHVIYRNCRAFIGSTNTEKLSRSPKLYNEQVGALEEILIH